MTGLFSYMANEDSDMVSLPEAMSAMYSEMDKYAQDMARKANSSCRKGCSNCCYLLAISSTIDGLNIAYHLVQTRSTKELRELVDALIEVGKKCDFPGLDNGTYFLKKIRCAFLSDQGECGIYSVRPASCRYHYVISPPENCSPDAKDGRTKIIDFRSLENAILTLNTQVTGKISGAPISLAVIAGLKTILKDAAETDEERKLIEYLDKRSQEVLTPDEWLHKHARNVHESTTKGTSGRMALDLK